MYSKQYQANNCLLHFPVRFDSDFTERLDPDPHLMRGRIRIRNTNVAFAKRVLMDTLGKPQKKYFFLSW